MKHLPHTPEALTGKRVRITRRGHQYVGTVTSAGPHNRASGGLSLILDLEDVGGVTSRSGFHLSPEAVVEDLDDDTPHEDRAVTAVGWDGRSQAMLRYVDELHLPDHMRSVAPVQPEGERSHVVMAPDGSVSEPLTYTQARARQVRLNADRDGCDYLVVPMSPPCTPHTVAGRRRS